MFHDDGGGGVEDGLETSGVELGTVDYRRGGGVQLVERQNLLVGILHQLHFVHKPAVA